jgi:hypothetical protein
MQPPHSNGRKSTDMLKWLKSFAALLVIAGILWASGIAPAIIPQAVPTANKRGNSTVFQLATSTATAAAGTVFCDDGSGNVTTAGCSTSGTLSGHSVSAVLTCPSSSASTTTYTCSTTPTFTPVAGDSIIWQPDLANTASSTLNVNSLGAKPITKQQTGAALVANDVLASPSQILMTYDGTNWEMQGQTGNAGGGGTTVTFSSPYVQFGGNSYGPVLLLTPPPAAGAGWTQVNFGTTGLTTTAGNAVSLQWQTAGSDLTRGYVRVKPGATYTITIECQSFTFSCGIMLFDSAATTATTYFIGYNPQKIFGFNWNNPNSFANRVFSDFTLGTLPEALPTANLWLRVKDDGVNEIFSISSDGVVFMQFNSRASGTFLVPDRIGIGSGDLNGSNATIGASVFVTSFQLTTP